MRRGILFVCVMGVLPGALGISRHQSAMADEAAKKEAELQAKQEEMRKKFPFVSLRERLAYEVREPDASEVLVPEDDPNPLYEGITVFRPIPNSLWMLHYAKAEEFFRVPERNGMSRMPAVSPATIVEMSGRDSDKLIKTEDSPYRPDTLGSEEPLELGQLEGKVPNAAEAPSRQALNGYLTLGGNIFCNAHYFGCFESIDRVAGFIPHHFYERPDLNERRSYPRGQTERNRSQFDVWRTTQLQLVSLLKHPEPRVYLSENLPNMTELVKVESRELNSFEEPALVRLKKGEMLVTSATTNTIRMLGALRARQECLNCHSVKSGALLGAFSYVLERDPPVSVQQLAPFAHLKASVPQKLQAVKPAPTSKQRKR